MSHEIAVRDLRLDYGRTTALRDISLDIEGPGIFGLLGRNGSGKTSLMSVLAGFRRATAGSVRFDRHPGFDNSRVTSQICLIRGSGDSVEHNWPFDRVTDALKLAADLRPHWDAHYAGELLERFELDRRKRLPAMSTGQRSTLGSILGLASRAPITMLDESYLGMDPPTRYAFYDELLKDYMEHPRTIILSSHLVEEIGPLLEKVIIIDRGRLLLHEDTEELRSRGATVTGPAEQVAEFTAGRTVLSERRLGPTAARVIDGELDHTQHARARQAGLELGPVPLQDLFVHLTGKGEA
jgi:ABC-2 type transport system ATP-binding protein